MKYEGFTTNTFKHQWTPLAVSALSAFLLTGAVTTTVNAQDNGSTTEQSNDVKATVNYVDSNNNVVGTKVYTTAKNTAVNYSDEVPSGYVLNTVGNVSTTGSLDTDTTIRIPVKSANSDVAVTIKYTDSNNNVVGTKVYNVSKNTNVDFSNDVPSGYVLNSQNTTVNSGANGIEYSVPVKSANSDVKATVNYVDSNNNVVGTKVYTAAKNTDVNYSDGVPSGYVLNTVDNVSTTGSLDTDTTIRIPVKSVNSDVKATVNYVDSNNNVVGTKVYTTAKNTAVNYSDGVPSGYVLNTVDNVSITGSLDTDTTISIPVKHPEINNNNVTATFVFTFNGKTLNTKSYTAAKNSEIDYGSAVPSGYKLNSQSTNFNVGEADSTNTFELSKIDTGNGYINYTPYFTKNQTSAANNTSAGSDAPIIFYSAPSSTSSSTTSDSASTSVSAQSSSAESSTQSSVSSNSQSSASQSSASNDGYNSSSNSSSASHASASNNAHNKKHLGVSTKHDHKHAAKKIETHNKNTNESAVTDNHNVAAKHQSNSNRVKLPQTGESSIAKSISLIGLVMVAFAGVLISLFKRSK